MYVGLWVDYKLIKEPLKLRVKIKLENMEVIDGLLKVLTISVLILSSLKLIVNNL